MLELNTKTNPDLEKEPNMDGRYSAAELSKLGELEKEELIAHIGALTLHLARVETKLTQAITDNEQLKTEVNKDSLTGLLNKKGFLEAANEVLGNNEELETNKKQVVMFLLDGKKFKSVNDTFGHQEGDRALKGIAGYLQNIDLRTENQDHSTEQRESDLNGEPDTVFLGRGGVIFDKDPVARLGGDEFAILVEVDARTTNTDEFVQAYKGRIQEAHQQFLSDEDNQKFKEIGLGISVGHAVWNGEENAEQLLHKADVSMYEDKKNSER